MKIYSIAFAALVGLAGSAAAQSATEVASNKAWTTFVSNDPGGKICFVASQPTDSKYSQTIKGRDPAFFQITSIPSKSIRNEASSIVGYVFDSKSPVTVEIDGQPFRMFLDSSHPDTAWAVPEQEVALVEAMKKGHVMTVKGTSSRGTQIADNYSLSGVTAAMDKMASECP